MKQAAGFHLEKANKFINYRQVLLICSQPWCEVQYRQNFKVLKRSAIGNRHQVEQLSNRLTLASSGTKLYNSFKAVQSRS